MPSGKLANSWTPGDPTGRFTFTSPQGQSVVDYFLVPAQHLSSVADMRVMCDAQYCNLSRDMPYDSEKPDHFPLQLDLSCTVGLISPVQHVYPCSEARHCQHRSCGAWRCGTLQQVYQHIFLWQNLPPRKVDAAHRKC